MDEAHADALRLVEACHFASPEPVPTAALVRLLGFGLDLYVVMDALEARYRYSGIQPLEVAGGWQFCTGSDLAPRLEPLLQRARRLPRAAMEVLAVIAQRQPVTRSEVEQVRCLATGQGSIDLLLDLGLIAPAGQVEQSGRPTLWQTTPAFLAVAFRN